MSKNKYPNISYLGFHGTVNYFKDEDIFYGNIQNIKENITYKGNDINELKENFQKTVEDYVKNLINDNTFKILKKAWDKQL